MDTFKGHWDEIFAEAHLHSWPTATLTISKAEPSDRRSIWKDDEKEIMAAAERHGYRVILTNKRVVTFKADRPGVLPQGLTFFR